MKFVLTIVADMSHNTVSEEHVEVIKKHLDGADKLVWLEKGRALDLVFEDTSIARSAGLAGTLQAELEDLKFDYCLQPLENRRKRLLIADMDSTIIQQECIDEIGQVLGLKDQIAEITEKAMRGELEFEAALTERVDLLKGITRDQLQTVLDKAIEITPGAEVLVKTMNADGALTALISGGFTFFTSKIADRVGFQHHQANELIFNEDQLSGEVRRPILGRDAKRDALITLRDSHNLSPAQTLAVGDGANDLAMIEEAGLGVAYHAKPAVSAAADAQIDKSDLTTLLFFQGYRKDEFLS